MKWVQTGPQAVLLSFADIPGEAAVKHCHKMVTELELHPPRFLKEFTPAYTTILLEFDLRLVETVEVAANQVMQQLKGARSGRTSGTAIKQISVCYNGPDLERVAKHTQLSVQQVIRLHSKVTYSVAFLGFAPGFPYLLGLPQKLVTPRLGSPRPRVAAGAVGIGGEHTGIYSIESPGGWNIIGHTQQLLFEPEKLQGENPTAAFLLQQGDKVQFIPTEAA